MATPYRHGGKDAAEAFFLKGMSEAIAHMALSSSPEFPATIYYAFKQSEVEPVSYTHLGVYKRHLPNRRRSTVCAIFWTKAG